MPVNDHFAITQSGFEWGPLVVTRIASDPRFGWVVSIALREKPYDRLEVRATWHGKQLYIDKLGPCKVKE